MTPDEAVEAAEAALLREDLTSASELYEYAGRAMVDNDQNQAIHLLKLASNYAPIRDDRYDQLAVDVQSILESTDGIDYEIADVLLGRAVAAEKSGHPVNAHFFYEESIRRLARTLMETAESYTTKRTGLKRFVEELEFFNEKVKYCVDRLKKLEGGNDG